VIHISVGGLLKVHRRLGWSGYLILGLLLAAAVAVVAGNTAASDSFAGTWVAGIGYVLLVESA
jgi:hypothetical protein